MKTIDNCYYFNVKLIIVLSLFLFSSAQAQWTKSVIDMQANGAILPATVADIQDDGDLDVLITTVTDFNTFAGEILWYEAPDWTKNVIDSLVGMIKAVDFNGDSKTDIVAANFATGEVVWYEAPSWTKHVIGANIQGVINIEVIDFDKDSDLDVVATEIVTGSVVWYEAPNWSTHTIATGLNEAIFFKIIDLDADSDNDVVVSSSSGLFWFEAPSWNVNIIKSEIEANQLDVGDIDRDGDLDVIIASTGSDAVLWYDNPSWTSNKIGDLSNAWGVVLTDLDKDNDLDVVASGQGSGEVIWYEAPNWIRHTVDNSLAGASGVTVVDMDNDDMPDIVACAIDAGQVVFYKSPLISGISEDGSSEIPSAIILHQNYPNPFNPSSTIHFTIPKSSLVTLRIYNLLGQEIETLVNEQKPAGEYKVYWSPINLPSGIYLYRLQAGDFDETRKLMLLK